jgi:hypothetical protein
MTARTHKYFVEAEALNLLTPRVRAKKRVQRLTHISERRQVLAVDENELWTDLLRLGNLHELTDAAAAGDIVARGQDGLLLHAQGQCLQGRYASARQPASASLEPLRGQEQAQRLTHEVKDDP